MSPAGAPGCGFGKNPPAATPAEQGENPPAARPAGGFLDPHLHPPGFGRVSGTRGFRRLRHRAAPVGHRLRRARGRSRRDMPADRCLRRVGGRRHRAVPAGPTSATAPCTRSAVLVRGLGRSGRQLAPAAGSLHHRGEGSQGGGRLQPQLDAADKHQAKEEEDAKGERIKGRGRRRGSRWAPASSLPWSPGSPAAT